MTATSATALSPATIEAIKQKAKRLSILSMMSTTAAGSGHPTSCMSAAELVAAHTMRALTLCPLSPSTNKVSSFVRYGAASAEICS